MNRWVFLCSAMIGLLGCSDPASENRANKGSSARQDPGSKPAAENPSPFKKFISAFQAGAGQKASSAKRKGAATPEQAVEALVKARKAGDVDGYLAQTAEPTRSELVMTLCVPLAREHFEAALVKKLGPAKPPAPGKGFVIPISFHIPTVTEFLRSLMSIRILSKKARGTGEVELGVWETRRRVDVKGWPDLNIKRQLTAVDTGEGWKLRFPVFCIEKFSGAQKDPDGKRVEFFVEDMPPRDYRDEEDRRKWLPELPRWVAVVEGLARDVRAGKFKSREQAEAALEKAEEAFRHAHHLPKMGERRIEK
jgi:hypothetical protein